MAYLNRYKCLKIIQCWHKLGEEKSVALAEMNVILMRKDPPFDMRFIYSTYILERAEQEGVLVVNKPQSLRDCNEKLICNTVCSLHDTYLS
jgi:glutathione synthase/RimK-type ligase-like ATP-grasp enzyme